MEQRLDELYPDSEVGTATGSLLPGMVQSVHEQKASELSNSTDSVFLAKQATMDDAPQPDTAELFHGVRPSIISAEKIF